jgi:hypothetical protein
VKKRSDLAEEVKNTFWKKYFEEFEKKGKTYEDYINLDSDDDFNNTSNANDSDKNILLSKNITNRIKKMKSNVIFECDDAVAFLFSQVKSSENIIKSPELSSPEKRKTSSFSSPSSTSSTNPFKFTHSILF